MKNAYDEIITSAVKRQHQPERIAARLGFQPHDLAIADVRIGRHITTLIVVPHRIWDRAFPSAKCMDLRFQAGESGYAAILVPQSVIEREPRLGNSHLLARTATIKFDASPQSRSRH